MSSKRAWVAAILPTLAVAVLAFFWPYVCGTDERLGLFDWTTGSWLPVNIALLVAIAVLAASLFGSRS